MSAHFSIRAFNTKPGWGFHCQFSCSFWCWEPSEPGKDLFFRKFSFVLADVNISWGEKRATGQVLWSHLSNTIKYFKSLFGWPSWIPYASHCFQCREARAVLRSTSNLSLAAWAYSALQWAPGVRKKINTFTLWWLNSCHLYIGFPRLQGSNGSYFSFKTCYKRLTYLKC